MADEAQYSDPGSNKRKYEEPNRTRVTGFSAPILPSSSPDAVPTSYSSVPPPVDDIQLAKQRAQEIAARLYSNASTAALTPPSSSSSVAETKRARVDNGSSGYDSGDRGGYGSFQSDSKAYGAPASSYGFSGGSKRISVPTGRVGVIIGKQGETIKYLQAQSGGAKIQVTRDADADLNCPTRDVEIMGTPDQIAKAEHLINEVLAEAESGGPAVGNRRSTGQAGETFAMKVPNNKVGLVIGKRGETIKSMQASTGARIQVIPLHLPPGDTSQERTVQIDGTTEQVEAAKQLVYEVISENRRNPGMGGGYSQQGYQARPPSGWASSGAPGQQPGNGYGQSGGYSVVAPQYNASQPSYPGYPPQPSSGGYSANWDQSGAAPTQQPSQTGSYDYYSQQPSHQQQNPGGSAAPADSTGYNYGQPPMSGYNQQGQGYSQDGYGGYQAPPQSGYGQPPAYDQHGYPAANYNASNQAPETHTSSYGSQGEPAQAPPVQPATGGQQAYTANQQPSPNPASYPPQGSAQPGYGMPPTSQIGYGTQPPAQSAYGPGYGAPPQAQKPPAQSPTTPTGYGQPPAVHPGYPHSQPPPSGYAQPDSGARVPPSGYGSTAAPGGYGAPSGQPGYGQAPPYNASYGAAGYTQPPAYSTEGADGNTRGAAYDAAGAPAAQTAQPSGVAKTSPQTKN